MEIKEIMELESGEKDELIKLLERYNKGTAAPEEVVGMINKLITKSFIIGRSKK